MIEFLLSQEYRNWAEEILLYIKVSCSLLKYSSGISLPKDNHRVPNI